MKEVTKFLETNTEAVRTWGFVALTSRVHQTLSCLRRMNGGTHHQPVSHEHRQAWPPPVRLSCVCRHAPQHTTPSLQAAPQGPSPGPLVPPHPLIAEAVLGLVRKLRPQPLPKQLNSADTIVPHGRVRPDPGRAQEGGLGPAGRPSTVADGAAVGLGTARVQKRPGVCGGSSEAKVLSPPTGVPDGGDARLGKQDHCPSDPRGTRLGSLGALPKAAAFRVVALEAGVLRVGVVRVALPPGLPWSCPRGGDTPAIFTGTHFVTRECHSVP